MLYPNRKEEPSVWQRVFSYPYHDGTHASYRIFPHTGTSVAIRNVYDMQEASTRIPYLTVGPWAALKYLQFVFDGPGSPIPVYRVRLENTAVVWSTSLTSIGSVRPTLIHCTGVSCFAHIVMITWAQLMRIYREEDLGLSTRFAMSAILRRRMVSDIPNMPDTYSALTHLYRPMLVKHGLGESPVLVNSGANAGTPDTGMPKMTHYSALQYVHNCQDGTRLQQFVLHAAQNSAYRMALMSRLSAGAMRFVDSEINVLGDAEAIREACSRMSAGVPSTLITDDFDEPDEDEASIDPAV